uniref:SWI/SNFrelated matrixassociated actindependent regulator of chromatin putative n=1 Tax=Albugo laibachii Nc14 TaxID=890382 RepID=F0WSX6_9STRA|nr:SWI/SNFrelated matrixassociated actindependent regulator of chromatin putative [Albugo laibachii Nc14]|eukprot:CCA24460.1 SWI/SNFrelated matrixassociated actindependent regulator of chromatin putative [Albugo laibachii Nc14]
MTSVFEALDYSCIVDPNEDRNRLMQEKVHLLRRMEKLHLNIDQKIQQYASNLQTLPADTTNVMVRRIIRLCVSHCFVHNHKGAEEVDAHKEKWRFQIETADARHLATYFRKIIVKCDTSDANNADFEWTNFQKSSQEMNKLEIARSGLLPKQILIQLIPSHNPERYTLSPELKHVVWERLQGNSQNLTNVDAFTKKDILVAFWEYVFHKNLMKEDDPSVLRCDEKLRVIFNECKIVPYSSIIIALERHLFLRESIDITYEPTEAKVSLHQNFDFEVFIPNDMYKRKAEIRSEWEKVRHDQENRLMQLQNHRNRVEKKLLEVLQRQQWMRHLALDPVEFMWKVEQSQKADREVLIKGNLSPNDTSQEAQFRQPWVADIISDIVAVPAASLLNGSK